MGKAEEKRDQGSGKANEKGQLLPERAKRAMAPALRMSDRPEFSSNSSSCPSPSSYFSCFFFRFCKFLGRLIREMDG